MPITQIDNNTALIAIDLQYGIVELVDAKDASKVIEHTNLLLNTFHSLNWPVVLVNVSGRPDGRVDSPSRSSRELKPNWTTLIEELNHHRTDIVITKQTWGAFTHTQLHQRLQSLNVTHVVITGIATSMGVLSTAMQAYELGYNVTICHDAVTDPSLANHAFALSSVIPKISEVGTTLDFISLAKSLY
ncbi:MULTISPECIES: cysteine hydrolase family protein [Vibrio]|uniref:cysteine hydrolase family protein n=1 Tax=Vibrio TaxID=662 RepID=UPI000BFFD006|nr:MULTISPECIES: isochorismatase family cysteine hydrolase [unclassified Vibrio]PHJ40903.1 hydrolase [Vibrio sp. PID17_43]RIZ53165.1 hydrolase [Vibrio sp. PID23_8]